MALVVLAAAAAPASAAELDVEASIASDGTAPAVDRDGDGNQEAGDDLVVGDGTLNGRVLTGDKVVFDVDWNYNAPNGTSPVLTLTIPPGFRFAVTPAIPAGACPGGLSTTTNPDDSQTLTCRQGPFNPGDDSVTRTAQVGVFVPLQVANGTQLTLTARVDDGGTPVTSTPPPTVVSAAPQAEIFKGPCASSNACGGRVAQVTQVDHDNDPTTPVVDGFVYDYIVGVRSPYGSDSRGLSEIEEPISFGDDVRIPAGPAGADGTVLLPTGPGQPGLQLINCTNTLGAAGERWPGVVADANALGAGNINNFVTQVDPLTCAQPAGKGGPVTITLSGLDWSRRAPPPSLAASNSNCCSATVQGVIGYGRVRYFLSYADWVAIGNAQGKLSQVPEIGGGTRTIGEVALGDRLVPLDAMGAPVLADNVGACTGSVIGVAPRWQLPVGYTGTADFGLQDAAGQASPLGLESVFNNGACASWEIIAPTPSSSQFGAQKFPVTPTTTVGGPAVAPDAGITTGLLLQNIVTLRNPSDAIPEGTPGSTAPGISMDDGSMTCDKWDNRRFGPNPADGAGWITPAAVAGAGAGEPVGGPQDYNAEYGNDAYTVQYAKGNWGTHNADEANAFYWQARSRCEDTATPFVGGSNPGSALLPVTGGGTPDPGDDVYWVGPDAVDFANGGTKSIDIEDVNAVRLILRHPIPGMLPSEYNAREGTADDVDTISDTNPVSRNIQARWHLSWRNRPGLAVPTHMRNYETRATRAGDATVLGWTNPVAGGSNDTTKTATVQPPCGLPCGSFQGIGSAGFSLWWQVLPGDAQVLKQRLSPSPVAANGDEVTYRLRARGVPPVGTAADATGVTPNVTIRDVLPPGLTYVPGSTVSSGAITVGEPVVRANNNNDDTSAAAAGFTTLEWTIPAGLPWRPDIDTNTPFNVQVRVTTDPLGNGESYTNRLLASSPSFGFPDSTGNTFDPQTYFRQSTAQVTTPAATAAALLNKSVAPAQLGRNTPFTFTLTYANFSSVALNEFDAVDILPWANDQAHTRNSRFTLPNPIRLLGVTPSAKNEVTWVSTVAPATLDLADAASTDHGANPGTDGYLDAEFAAATGSAQWPCTIAQVGAAGRPAGCPADLSTVTALRFVGTGTPFLAANQGPFAIKLNYTTTADARPGDGYDNSWMARFRRTAGDPLLPVFRPILVPPTIAPPEIGIEKKSGPSSTGPWDESTTVQHGQPVFFRVTVTNNGVNPLRSFVFDDPALDACETPNPAPPASLAPGASFEFVCTDPTPLSYTNTIKVTAVDFDDNPTMDENPAEVVVPSVSVGNFVWRDLNRDGVQDPGEPGIPGVTMTLRGPTGNPVTNANGVVVPVVTDADGKYSFDGLPVLPAGQHYTVAITGPQPALDRLTPTITTGGTPATNSSTGSAESTDLTTDGASDPTLDFGFVTASVRVGDFVWIDINANGRQDGEDPGIPGITLTLVGPGGGPVTDVNGNLVGPQVTDANGKYLFASLPALPAGQHYTVRLDNAQSALAALGVEPTRAGIGETAFDSSTGSAESGDLTVDGAADLRLDFGFVRIPPVVPPSTEEPPPPAGPPPATPPATESSITPRVLGVVAIRKSAGRPEAVRGQLLPYTITVRNPGTTTIARVLVCDALPAGETHRSSTPAATLVRGKWCWTLSSLRAGASRTVRIMTRVGVAARGTRMSNRVTATGATIRTRAATATVPLRGRVRVRRGGVTG